MAKKVSLQSIREGIESKYESTFIEIGGGKEVELLNPLRLSDEKLDELQRLSKDISGKDDEDEDSFSAAEITERLEKILRLSAKDDAQGEALVSACGGERAVLTEIVEAYFEEQEVGEASPSES